MQPAVGSCHTAVRRLLPALWRVLQPSRRGRVIRQVSWVGRRDRCAPRRFQRRVGGASAARVRGVRCGAGGVWRLQRARAGLGPLHDRPTAIIVVRLGSRRRRTRRRRPSRLQLRIALRVAPRAFVRGPRRGGAARLRALRRGPARRPRCRHRILRLRLCHPRQRAAQPGGIAAGRRRRLCVPRRHIMRAVLHLRRRPAAAATATAERGGPGCFERGLLGEGRRGAAADLDPGRRLWRGRERRAPRLLQPIVLGGHAR